MKQPVYYDSDTGEELVVEQFVDLVPVDLELEVHELYGALFTVTSNGSKTLRDGSLVHVMIDVAFEWPDGDNLGKISTLPYTRTGPEFAVSGLVITPEETVVGSGYYTTHQIIVRPDVDNDGSVRLFWPTGFFYHPEEMYAGEYRLLAEFFYYTDGGVLGGLYVQDFESEDVYMVNLESTTVYKAAI